MINITESFLPIPQPTPVPIHTRLLHAIEQGNFSDLRTCLLECDTKTLESAIKLYPHIDFKFHLEQAILLEHTNFSLVKSYQKLFTNPHPAFLIINPAITEQFLKNGANSNEQDEKGYSALHYLASRTGGNLAHPVEQGKNDTDCLLLLLRFGADFCLRANDLLTPLDIACRCNNKWFLEHFLKCDTSKLVQRPLLHSAILADNLALIKQLSASCDPKVTDVFGETALEIAIRYRSLQAVQLLSSWASQDDLSFAIKHADSKIVSCLINHLFPTGEIDATIMTDWFVDAMENENCEVADWIVEHYADLCLDSYRLCKHLLFSSIGSKYIDLFQKRAGEIKDRGDMQYLFFDSLENKKKQHTSFLLELIGDIDFSDDDQEDLFCKLFEHADTETVEQVIKKITINDGFFLSVKAARLLFGCHPHLFDQLSCKLLEQGFSLCQVENCCNTYLQAVMTLAIFSGRLNQVERCYNQFFTSDEIKKEHTAYLLLFAIDAGHPELVSWVLEKNLQTYGTAGRSFKEALELSKKLGNMAVTQTLVHALQQHHIPVDDSILCIAPPGIAPPPRLRVVEARDALGKTELFRAVEEGNFSEAKRLLDLGSNPNSQDICGTQILAAATRLFTQGYYAMTGKAFALIALLVERGASCTRMIGSHYLNIFDWAFSQLNYGVLFALHQHYKQHIPISSLALYNFYKTCEVQDLEFILKHYPNIELQSYHNDSDTICHAFIDRNRLDLLEKYAEASPQNFKKYLENKQNGRSLLYDALFHGKSEMTAFLRAKGASFHHDPTLLTISPELAKQFLDEGMNVNEQDAKGFTALHCLAYGGGDSDCIPILLSRGIDFSLSASDGETALSMLEHAPLFCWQILKAAVSSNIPRESLPEKIFADVIATAIFYQDFNLLKTHALDISEDHLIVAAKHGSVNVVSFLIEQYFSTRKEDEKIIRGIFYEALEYKNAQVSIWLIEKYALRYLQAFGPYLLDKACIGAPLSVLQECMQEMKKSPDNHEALGALFIKAVKKKQTQIASFLLELIDDLSFFEKEENLYRQLFKHGERELCEKALKKYPIPDEGLADTELLISLNTHQPELFTQLIPIVIVNHKNLEDCFLLALQLRHKLFLHLVVQGLCQQKTIDFTHIYAGIFILVKESQISEETLKQALLWTIKIQRRGLPQDENEKIASSLTQIAALSSEPQEFSLLVTHPAALFLLTAAAEFAQKISSLCKIPCGHLSLTQTRSWIIKEVFVHCYRMNPELFCTSHVFDSIGDLVGQVRKNEDYGALFVALQTAPNIETVEVAFQRAKAFESGGLIKPTKALFVDSSFEEQKRWITYALVYRDRTFIPHCYCLIKHHDTHPALLDLTLLAIQHIGVRRFSSDLENSLESTLQSLLQTCHDEKIKIKALKAYIGVSKLSHNMPLLDFLLEQLQDARKRNYADYEAVLSRLLGTHYEWTSDEECTKAVKLLAFGLESPHEEVRFQTAVALSAIPQEQGLLAALEVVQSPTWDRMLEHFGKDRRDSTGSYLTFIRRPSDLHDSRSAMRKRILLQLVRVHEREGRFASLKEPPSSEEMVHTVEQSFQLMDISSTRYISIPVAYPPGTDLLRGISTRKGSRGFREAVRDLFRKGAGSSEVTDYDTMMYSNTWNKIGHMFASHSKELFFGSKQASAYFSTDKNGVVTESALIVFPASYYHKEYLLGEARLEREVTFNNVLYRGIPHRWIKAVYLPERFRQDIERLASLEPLEKVVKGFTSDLFKDDSIQALTMFRRLLTAVEMDLTQEPSKPVPFYKKIRYFAPQNVEEVGKLLEKDGVSFASVEAIKKETLLLRRKTRFLTQQHYKDPWRFSTQDLLLVMANDAEFKANQDRFFTMLPKALFPTEEASKRAKHAMAMLKTDGFEKLRAQVRMACLLMGFEETKVVALLKQNPAFYGLTFGDIALVCSLIRSGAPDGLSNYEITHFGCY